MSLADLRSLPSRLIPIEDVREWAETAGSLVALFGIPAALGAWWRRRVRRRALERELRDAVAEVVVVLADRAKAEFAQEFGGYFTETEYRDRRVVLRDRLLKARKRLWKAMGFPESTDDEAREQIRLLRALRMTQRWNADKAKEAERAATLSRK